MPIFTTQSVTATSPLQHQRGFTLMEVLVSMIVLSIGLLGLAGLQLNSLKNSNSSYERSQANLLASEIIDRIRANRVGLAAGDYDDLYSSSTDGTSVSNPVADPGCITVGCTTAELAQYDAFLWQENLKTALPFGRGRVVGNGLGSVFSITILWDDERTGATGVNCGVDHAVDLSCFIMSTRL
ncbi:MAG: type IV pilus modification protein PilV [Gammaproteobacteria bacterium]|nr:type IV pilus modification protein PilV [Gammaproteobacteria bacterium]